MSPESGRQPLMGGVPPSHAIPVPCPIGLGACPREVTDASRRDDRAASPTPRVRVMSSQHDGADITQGALAFAPITGLNVKSQKPDGSIVFNMRATPGIPGPRVASYRWLMGVLRKRCVSDVGIVVATGASFLASGHHLPSARYSRRKNSATATRAVATPAHAPATALRALLDPAPARPGRR